MRRRAASRARATVAPLHVESPVTDVLGIGSPHFGLGDDWLL